jgi:multiple sugar transport system permease protein
MTGFVFLTIGPMIASLYLSFTDYHLLTRPHWIGLENYLKLGDDNRYRSAVAVTLKYVFIGVPVKLAFALLVAIVLRSGVRALAVYRAAYYVPSLFGGSVAVAILWRQLFGQPGLIQQALALIHVDSQGWLTNPSTALSTLIILEVWQFGSPMIIFLAALRQIPHDLYEAAAVDGAVRLRAFWHITLPVLTPIIFFNLVLQMIGSFQAFTPSFVVSGGSGGPVDSTLFYTLYLYIEGFGRLQMGYASAMAWVLLLGIAAVTGGIFLTSRYWVYYGDS